MHFTSLQYEYVHVTVLLHIPTTNCTNKEKQKNMLSIFCILLHYSMGMCMSLSCCTFLPHTVQIEKNKKNMLSIDCILLHYSMDMCMSLSCCTFLPQTAQIKKNKRICYQYIAYYFITVWICACHCLAVHSYHTHCTNKDKQKNMLSIYCILLHYSMGMCMSLSCCTFLPHTVQIETNKRICYQYIAYYFITVWVCACHCLAVHSYHTLHK